MKNYIKSIYYFIKRLKYKNFIKMDWLESEGTLVYDPHGRATKNQMKLSDPWWLLLICDNGIVDYYNYWIIKKGFRTFKYSLYGSHISIIKGEEPLNKELWKKYHGEKIKFQYSNHILDNLSDSKASKKYWWLPVNCLKFEKIREELGLSSKANMRFHLTIARQNLL